MGAYGAVGIADHKPVIATANRFQFFHGPVQFEVQGAGVLTGAGILGGSIAYRLQEIADTSSAIGKSWLKVSHLSDDLIY
jgi:hypothetical protein